MTAMLGVVSISAQDSKKKDGMKMDEMQKSPHHSVMMAYKQNSLTFAKALRDMTKEGKFDDVELARNSFAEIKRSMEKTHEVHSAHMSRMAPDMLENMKPMMEKMKAEKAAVKENMQSLEKALQSDAPDAQRIGILAGELVMKLDMNEKSGMKKKMTEHKKK